MLPLKTKSRDGFTWGFVSQGFSSGTNFALTLIGARVLGPGGLGVIAIAYTTYLVVLSFQRALVTDPLVTRSASQPAAEAKVKRPGLRARPPAVQQVSLPAPFQP